MKPRHHLYLLPLLLLLWGCNDNPAWMGANPKGKVEELAGETCKCIYQMAGEEAGWDRAAILEEIENIRKTTPPSLLAAIKASENPAIVKAMQAEYDFSMKMDDCDCMKPVQDGLLERGVDFDEMMDLVDHRCMLGAFYN